MDEEIIQKLKENSRRSYLGHAKELGVSEGAVRSRVNRLVKEWVIKRFTIEVQMDYSAVVNIETSSRVPTRNVKANVWELSEQVFEVTGKASLVAIIKSNSLEELNETIEKIRMIKGVVSTETNTILG